MDGAWSSHYSGKFVYGRKGRRGREEEGRKVGGKEQGRKEAREGGKEGEGRRRKGRWEGEREPCRASIPVTENRMAFHGAMDLNFPKYTVIDEKHTVSIV